MVLRAPDANTEVGGTSSSSPDDKGAASSTAVQSDANAGKPTAEQTAEVATTESSTEVENENPFETPVEGGEERTEQAATEAEVEQTEVQVPLDKPEDEKLPFHKEPRFQELVKEKNQYKQELDAVKPLAARAKVLDDYVIQNNIQPAQLQSALEYLRLLNTDPAKAYEMLKPTYEQLSQFTGDRLPADLQDRVAAGTLDAELAKEIAQGRGNKQWQTAQQQMQGQTAAQRAEFAIQGSIDAWASATMAKDPDLKPKAPGAVDGKWEYVDMKLRSLRQANPPKTPQEAVALTEQAYTEANKFFGVHRVQRPIVKKTIQSNNNSQNASAVVKTAEDVTRAIISGKRPHQLKYS